MINIYIIHNLFENIAFTLNLQYIWSVSTIN